MESNITLNQFIINTLLEIGKDLELAKTIETQITDEARKRVKGNCACISDSEVKEMIIKLANKEKIEKQDEPAKLHSIKIGDKYEQEGLF